ncbi:MAG: hypothetical protein H6972_02150 [Gammaproteobacteria bacterium]|nr:hypothetical protein [Gammaproteobacteria bacterium]
MRLWDVAGRTEAHRFEGHAGGVRACGFSPDGRWLATGGTTGRCGCGRGGRTEAHRFEGHAEGLGLRVFAGRALAGDGGRRTVRLWTWRAD